MHSLNLPMQLHLEDQNLQFSSYYDHIATDTTRCPARSVWTTDRSERERSSLLQVSSCYIVVCHSIGAALFVCTVIWWENFVSLCPLRLDRGHVGGWEMKRRRCGRIQSLSSGFKACFTHSLWTVVCKKCLWMCLWRSNTQLLSYILVISGIKYELRLDRNI